MQRLKIAPIDIKLEVRKIPASKKPRPIGARLPAEDAKLRQTWCCSSIARLGE